MTEQELINMNVLVHPLLLNDPAKRSGQIGTIIDADIRRDDFTVLFDDNRTALYSSSALIIPKSADRIYDHAVKHEASISYELRQVLADYANHIEYYGAEAQKGSLRLVQANDSLMEFLTDPLKDMLEITRPYKIGR
ncbi:hypothetical protein MTO98_16050 [Mucilaginibacter sp. SMC90]|uniref:hypothetical protein n=1 Tax=Mucilaginibacter sp. SMC90 TaxID=2929803 RepID=UPI001FB35070|nr:hypothetical protein [Mucilaginibacter sp. SMC90]UOE52590.1 hypothetical protein MTO98_16050 [Mucilaginibacter sp. SMC90]